MIACVSIYAACCLTFVIGYIAGRRMTEWLEDGHP